MHESFQVDPCLPYQTSDSRSTRSVSQPRHSFRIAHIPIVLAEKITFSSPFRIVQYPSSDAILPPILACRFQNLYGERMFGELHPFIFRCYGSGYRIVLLEKLQPFSLAYSYFACLSAFVKKQIQSGFPLYSYHRKNSGCENSKSIAMRNIAINQSTALTDRRQLGRRSPWSSG